MFNSPKKASAQREIDVICDAFETAHQMRERPQWYKFVKMGSANVRKKLAYEIIHVDLTYRAQKRRPKKLQRYLNERVKELPDSEALSQAIEDAFHDAAIERERSQQSFSSHIGLDSTFQPRASDYESKELTFRSHRFQVYDVERISDHRRIRMTVMDVRDKTERFCAKAERVSQWLRQRGAEMAATPLLDFGLMELHGDEGAGYFATDWIHAEPIAMCWQTESDGLASAASWISQVGHTLASAHRQGIVHGALTLESVVLTVPDGRPMLVEFGLDAPADVTASDDTISLAKMLQTMMLDPCEVQGDAAVWVGQPDARQRQLHANLGDVCRLGLQRSDSGETLSLSDWLSHLDEARQAGLPAAD
ncbi:MAG: hypothetical protein AAF958_10270 [Planctomycetota bacterium]